MKFYEYIRERKEYAEFPRAVKTEKDLVAWLKTLPLDAVLRDDVINPETGEVLFRKGQTKRKFLRNAAGKPRAGLSLQDIKDIAADKHHEKKAAKMLSRDQIEHSEFYDVEKVSAEDLVDDPKAMRAADYDIDVSVPKKVTRADGGIFDDQDVKNIQAYAKWYNRNVMPRGMEIVPTMARKAAMAEFDLMFK
jgi:hypothetical protein